jgi:hypothetical protein
MCPDRETDRSQPMLPHVPRGAKTAIVHTPRLPLGGLEVVAEHARDYAAAAKKRQTP